MRGHQFLDARRGAVEAFRQPGDLVLPLDGDARGEVAGRERLDAALQTLDAARQPTRHRIGADGDNRRNDRERK